MASLNKVNLIGNLGADPEIRRTQSGEPIANLRIATTEKWRAKATGDMQERTELQTRKWTDKEGNDRYSTEVVLQRFNGSLILLDNAQRNEAFEHRKDPTPKRDAYLEETVEDEIPF
jgi:single-strand DNA-binding protein